MIQPKGRAKIKTTDQGIEITIPARANDVVTSSNTKGGGIGFLCFWFAFWTFGGFMAILKFLEGLFSTKIEWFLGFWLCGWAAGEITVGYILAKAFFGAEKIVLTGTDVSIGDYILRFGKAKFYELAKISNLRLATQDTKQGAIQFTYGAQTFHCGKYLDNAEAEQLAKNLADILTFCCHAVGKIVFGASQVPTQESITILHNPDVTDLTFPFVRLKQVVIYPETADFYQIERFLTYAVNYIGQEYLKDHVEVHIYGDPEQLHPNLHNNFENLCKHLHFHQ